MKKKTGLTMAIIASFLIGLSVNNIAFSNVASSFKVAVVNVNQVVANSSEVNALKTDKQKKNDDLMKFIKTAKSNLDAEKNSAKKKTLEKKYNDQLSQKRKTIEGEYAKKLSSIEKNINKAIKDTAEKNKYDVVLSKNVVLYGGDDITAEVSKIVK